MYKTITIDEYKRLLTQNKVAAPKSKRIKATAEDNRRKSDIFIKKLKLFASHIPEPQREYRFKKVRKWPLDFAWVDKKVYVEIQGGGWSRGRHHRPEGYQNDCEKHNAAVVEGWRGLNLTYEMIDANFTQIINQLDELLKLKGRTT